MNTILIRGNEVATKAYVDSLALGGSGDVTLNDYYTKSDTDYVIDTKIANADISSKLTNYYNKNEVDTLLEELDNPTQFAVMPAASAENVNMIVQYIGTTDTNYTNGYFYKSIIETSEGDSSTYKWIAVSVQDVQDIDLSQYYTKEEVDNIAKHEKTIVNNFNISVATDNVPGDISADNRLIAYRISNYTIKIEDSLTNTFISHTDSTLSTYSVGISSIRFDYHYIKDEENTILNVYYGGCRHDGDYFYVSCLRILITDTGIELLQNNENYSSHLISANWTGGWDGSYIALYPHPTHTGILMAAVAVRSSSTSSTTERLYCVNIDKTTISRVGTYTALSINRDTARNEYLHTYGYWCQNDFYAIDRTLTKTFKINCVIENNFVSSTTLTDLSTTYPTTGFKYFTSNYYTINNIIYNKENEIIKTLPYENAYVLLNEQEDLLIALIFTSGTLYIYNVFEEQLLETITLDVDYTKLFHFNVSTTSYVFANTDKTYISTSTIRAINSYKQIDYVKLNQVLTKDNQDEYTPVNDYNPATKKYVDDTIAANKEELGITTYSGLSDKPSINNVILEGNKTLEELGIQPAGSDATHDYITTVYNNGYNDYTAFVFEKHSACNTLGEFLNSRLSSLFVEAYNKVRPVFESGNKYAIIINTTGGSTLGAMHVRWLFNWEGSNLGWTYIDLNSLGPEIIGNDSYKVYANYGENGDFSGFSNISQYNYEITGLGINNTTEYTPTGDYNPATKKYVDNTIATSIAGISSTSMEIATSLPTENISTSTIYLVKDETASTDTENIYNEYIYVNGAWENIGSTKTTVDLSQYSTTEEMNAAIAAEIAKIDISKYLTSTEASNTYATKTEISNMYSKTEVNTAIENAIKDIEHPTTDLSNYYNKQEIDTMIGNINTILDAINGEEV